MKIERVTVTTINITPTPSQDAEAPYVAASVGHEGARVLLKRDCLSVSGASLTGNVFLKLPTARAARIFMDMLRPILEQLVEEEKKNATNGAAAADALARP